MYSVFRVGKNSHSEDIGTVSILDEEPDLHPEPSLGNHQVADCSLATIEGKLLIL